MLIMTWKRLTMAYDLLLDYIAKEFKADKNDIDVTTDDMKKIVFKNGKKFAQNWGDSLKAFEVLASIVKTYNLLGVNIDDYITLVPDDVAAELIELYEVYRIDTYIGEDIDVIKYFRKVHSISLVNFAFAYARYNELDEYLGLWLKVNPSNSPEEAFTTKADAINTYNESCKKYNTSREFIRESIKLLKPYFGDKSRIKMTQDYTDRKDFLDKFNQRHDIDTETKIDEIIKDIDETDRNKFR